MENEFNEDENLVTEKAVKKDNSKSVRLTDEVNNAFGVYSENIGKSRNDALNKLLEMAKFYDCKLLVPDRKKEIETFQDTINSLVKMYTSSLDLNLKAEENIAKNFSLELNSKDSIIHDLQAKIAALKTEKEELKDIKNQNIVLDKDVQNLSANIEKKEKKIEQLNTNMYALNSIIVDYKKYKNSYDLLEVENKKNKADNDKLSVKNSNQTSKIEILTTQVETLKITLNLEKTEYKSNLKALKDDYTANLKDIKNEYNTNLKTLKAESSANLKVEREDYKSNVLFVKQECLSHIADINKQHLTTTEQLTVKQQVEINNIKTIYTENISSLNVAIIGKDNAITKLNEKNYSLENLILIKDSNIVSLEKDLKLKSTSCIKLQKELDEQLQSITNMRHEIEKSKK